VNGVVEASTALQSICRPLFAEHVETLRLANHQLCTIRNPVDTGKSASLRWTPGIRVGPRRHFLPL